MLKKSISFIGWVLLLCLLLLLSFFIAISNDWPTLSALFLWVGIIAMILISYGIGLTLIRLYRDGRITALFTRMRLSRMEYVLSRQWGVGVAVIKRIQRKKPVIPWFIFTGKRCGKSTVLSSSGLPMHSHETQDGTIVPTRTLRWWFFRSAGFLDLSSLFLSGNSGFERAWLRLTKWCKRLPAPAGVIVCVSMKDLLTKDPVSLHLDARRVRTQLEPLIKALRIRLPVYLFITCSDEMPGFSLWASSLSPAQRNQPLGYAWTHSPLVDSKDPAFLSELFSSLKQGVDLSRISMLDGSGPTEKRLALFDFPEQLARLQPALQRYIGALCEPDTYFESASLKGVWLTASEQISKNSTARQALFLQDLMTERLPEFSRTYQAQFIGWHRRVWQCAGRALIAASLCLALTVSGILSAELMGGAPDTLSAEQLVDALTRVERWHQQPVRYLPFIPLLQKRHQQIEDLLVRRISPQPERASQDLERYRQSVVEAQPTEKRQLILALAHSILQQQQLLQTDSLAALPASEEEPAALNLTGAVQPLPAKQDIALRRALLHRPAGIHQLAQLRALLRQLVDADSDSIWLTASAEELSTVSISDFWTVPATDDVRVDGRWTLAGEQQTQRWMAQVEQALGEHPQTFTRLTQAWPHLRQNAWLPLVIAGAKMGYTDVTPSQWQGLLIAVDRGESPAQRLALRTLTELTTVTPSQAQPWLEELRRLDTLRRQAGHASLSVKVERFDRSLRQKLSSLFRIKPDAMKPVVTSGHLSSWLAWQNSVHTAVTDAIGATDPNYSLTRGLFTSAGSEQKNPLQLVFQRFELMHTRIATGTDDYGVNAVWGLYKSDARLLLESALAHSACWIQRAWESQVLWPMTKNADGVDYGTQQDSAQQYLTDFIRGPAKNVLVVGENGAKAGEYQGQQIRLTPEFMHLVNYTLRPEDVLALPQRETTRSQDQLAKIDDEEGGVDQQFNVLEAKVYKVDVMSQPATIPGGARLMPTGTRLRLACDDIDSSLTSMNFSDKSGFRWRPGHCSRVSLVVVFPGFELQYNYVGDSAWPDFLADFAQGEHRFNAKDFGEDEPMLASLGIKQILVRYKPGNQDATQQAWQTWQALDARRTALAEKRQELSEHTTEEQFPTTLTGKISQLPATVAICP